MAELDPAEPLRVIAANALIKVIATTKLTAKFLIILKTLKQSTQTCLMKWLVFFKWVY